MKPMPFQAEVLEEIDAFRGRALLALDMGLGKSLTTLKWVRYNQEWPAVVVCPASVKWQWQAEARAAVNVDPLVLEGQTSKPIVQAKLVVVNYDILSYWLKHLLEWKPRTVIIDESQFLANRKTKRTTSVRKLCQKSKNVLALSGTPLLNRPIELWSTLNILCPKAFEHWYKFAQEFCAPEYTPWGTSYKGSSKPKKLHRLLKRTCMIRRKKEEVLPDLPPKSRRMVTIPLDNPAEYAFAYRDFLSWLAKEDPSKVLKAKRALAITRVGHLLRLVARLKLPSVVEWVDLFLTQTDEKLVVFAKHQEIVESLAVQIKEPSVVIYGKTPTNKRRQAVREFQEGATRLLIGNITAAGVGLNLTAASNVAFVEMAWRPGDHLQAEDRCNRIGQVDAMWVYYLIAHGTIEERLCRLVQAKQKDLSAILDGEDRFGGFDVFDDLFTSMVRA